MACGGRALSGDGGAADGRLRDAAEGRPGGAAEGPPGGAADGRLRRTARAALTALADALGFLTVAPVRARSGPPGPAAIVIFPLVGALLGALVGGVRWALDGVLGDGLAALAATATLIAATGALHLDGLADCADALGARDPERRRAAMSDPRLGTFGVVAVVLWLLALQTSLARLDAERALLATIAAGSCARFAALAQAATAVPARATGLGATFAPGGGTALAASVVALPGALAPALASPRGWLLGLLLLVGAGVVGLLTGLWATRALGGRSGDTLGAAIAGTEALALVAAAAALA